MPLYIKWSAQRALHFYTNLSKIRIEKYTRIQLSFAIDDSGIKMNNVYALSKNDETKQEKKFQI